MEDCCSPSKSHQEKTDKGGESRMDWKKILPWIVIGVLALVVIYVFFLRGSGTGQVVRSGYDTMVGGC